MLGGQRFANEHIFRSPALTALSGPVKGQCRLVCRVMLTTQRDHNSSDIKHLSCVQKAVYIFNEKLEMQLIMSVVFGSGSCFTNKLSVMNLDLKSHLA